MIDRSYGPIKCFFALPVGSIQSRMPDSVSITTGPFHRNVWQGLLETPHHMGAELQYVAGPI